MKQKIMKMKKIKKLAILFTVLTMIVVSILPVKANTSDAIYEYSTNQFSTAINEMNQESNMITTEIEENDETLNFSFDKDYNYVVLNNKYYTFTDFNSASQLQAENFSSGGNMTIKEALNQFAYISNVNDFINKVENEKRKNDTNILHLTMKGRASYGVDYDVGIFKKTSVAFNLGSAAVSVIISYFTGGLGCGVWKIAQSAITSFIKRFLVANGVDYLTTSAVYRKWQAILNSRGTTRETRLDGAINKNGTYFWDYNSNKYSRTFESVRPGY